MKTAGFLATIVFLSSGADLSSAAPADGAKDAAAYAARAAAYDARKEFDKAIVEYTKMVELSPRDARAYQGRGEDYFRLGKFKESVADFDKVIELEPDREPYHWQRGIALYYAGEFERGARQFEKHKTVNPDDVENAAWHYLCVARVSGVEKAKQVLIPVSGDARVPMAQVQLLFAGKATPDDVLGAAKAGNPSEAELRRRLFYAHLYIGLHHEAAGNAAGAREQVVLAAEKYADDDYMGDVARVHAALVKDGAAAKSPKPQ
jgi:lipoprotein NlpI